MPYWFCRVGIGASPKWVCALFFFKHSFLGLFSGAHGRGRGLFTRTRRGVRPKSCLSAYEHLQAPARTIRIGLCLQSSELGFIVAKPYGDNERYDFVVDSGQRLWRVQVKSTSYLHSGSYRVLALRHWRGQIVTYQPSEVDLLVAHVYREVAWFVLPIMGIGYRLIM